MYHILPTSEGNIIGIRIQGRIGANDYKTLLPFIKTVIEEHKNIRILLDLQEIEGFAFFAFLKNIAFILKLISKVEKEGVITDQQWICVWVKFLSPLFKTQFRCFPSLKIEEAWEWVSK